MACLLRQKGAKSHRSKNSFMRNFTLFITLFLCCNSALAQIEKGTVQVGGSVRFNNEDNTNFAETTNLGIYPRAAWFISDKISAGILLSMAYSKTDDGTAERTGHSFGYGVYTRLHKPVSENLYFFLQASGSYSSGKIELGNPIMEFENNRLDIFLQPGLIYFITDKLGIELTFGSAYYIRAEDDGFGGTIRNATGLNLGLNSVGLGASLYL